MAGLSCEAHLQPPTMYLSQTWTGEQREKERLMVGNDPFPVSDSCSELLHFSKWPQESGLDKLATKTAFGCSSPWPLNPRLQQHKHTVVVLYHKSADLIVSGMTDRSQPFCHMELMHRWLNWLELLSAPWLHFSIYVPRFSSPPIVLHFCVILWKSVLVWVFHSVWENNI